MTSRARVRETSEVAEAAARMIRAVGKRAGGDVTALALLAQLGDLVEQQMCEAAQAATSGAHGGTLRWSWADVGRVLGTSKQAAHQRLSGTARRPGTSGPAGVKGQLTLDATG